MSEILVLREKLDKKEITGELLFDSLVKRADKYQSDINSFVTIEKEYNHSDNPASLINNIPYSLKDNFSTKGILTTASSNILKDYIPVYDATVYKKLTSAGGVLIGKTVMDELGMGGTGTTGHTGPVKNPWDLTRISGGSSAGSVTSVALGIVPFSIGSDTGDSVRKPAAYNGVVGFKPTYGRISRYGLFAFASSMDHVGIIARSVKDIAIVTDILKGPDEFDMTTLEDDQKVYSNTLDESVEGKKLFYFKDICSKEYYKDEENKELNEILDKFHEDLEKIKSLGITIEEVDFEKELLRAIDSVYKVISCAEATSNNANLTGIQFGLRGEGNSIDEIMFDARTKGFSELIKRRFVLGSYILQKENQERLFLNAKRVRGLIVQKMDELFKEYDGLIMPASESIAPKFSDATDKLKESNLMLIQHMAIGNFGGYPSITIPSGFVQNMPIGLNITSPRFKDDLVLNIAYKIESILGYSGQMVGEENV